MFVYSKTQKDIRIAFDSTLPVETPDYIFTVDKENKTVYCNKEVTIISNKILESDTVYEKTEAIKNKVTLDLNGKTVKTTSIEGNGVFHVQKDGLLIIDGKGTVDGVSASAEGYHMAIWADGGKVIIKDGTFTNKGAKGGATTDQYDLMYVKGDGVLEIDGGFFDCETPRWTLNINNAGKGSIIVRGGTFVNYNPAESYTDEKGKDIPSSFVAEGYTVISEKQSNGDIWYTVVKK